MQIIEASIPLFFALIGLELVWAWAARRKVYRLNDSIADLSCGVLSQLTGVVIKVGLLWAFVYTTTHWSIQRFLPVPAWPDGPPVVGASGFPGFTVVWPAAASWVTVFILVDLAYYWLHRLSHEVHILWAGHVVHHSSEEYNLTVALRQSSLHGLMSWVFYMPLAFLGVPWLPFVVCHGLNLIYQFWIHTRHVGRLGPLEWVMNTPSHHRVHHGVNPKYQDRNFAGVFIVWDKLFGTFVPEEEEPVYGITIPLRSWNPLWANVHVFTEIWRNARATRRWRDKLRVVFGRPSWRPPDLGRSIVAPEVSAETYERFDPPVPPGLRRYAGAQFVAVLLASIWVLRIIATLPFSQAAALAFYIVLSLANLGALLEGQRWVFWAELARLTTLAGVAAALWQAGEFTPWLVLGTGLLAAVSLAWLVGIRDEFQPNQEAPAAIG